MDLDTRGDEHAGGVVLYLVIGALVLVASGLAAWYTFGQSVRTLHCCGTSCWEVDDEGEPIDPTQVDCVTPTIQALPSE
ncbi:MAG: hypothetical protein AAGE52_20215 [Myxococcota bacterium]